MTVEVACTVRDYDPTTQTATVELTGAGGIDTWLDGIQVHVAINRAWLAYGIPGVLAMPDVHRICEASLVGVYPPGKLYTANGTVTGSGQSGRLALNTNNLGVSGVGVVGFSPAFSSVPIVRASADNGATLAITGVTAAQFSIQVTAGGIVNGQTYFTWYADYF